MNQVKQSLHQRWFLKPPKRDSSEPPVPWRATMPRCYDHCHYHPYRLGVWKVWGWVWDSSVIVAVVFYSWAEWWEEFWKWFFLKPQWFRIYSLFIYSTMPTSPIDHLYSHWNRQAAGWIFFWHQKGKPWEAGFFSSPEPKLEGLVYQWSPILMDVIRVPSKAMIPIIFAPWFSLSDHIISTQEVGDHYPHL